MKSERYYLLIFVPIALSTIFFANTLYSPFDTQDDDFFFCGLGWLEFAKGKGEVM